MLRLLSPRSDGDHESHTPLRACRRFICVAGLRCFESCCLLWWFGCRARDVFLIFVDKDTARLDAICAFERLVRAKARTDRDAAMLRKQDIFDALKCQVIDGYFPKLVLLSCVPLLNEVERKAAVRAEG